jgi:hypothetical protein
MIPSAENAFLNYVRACRKCPSLIDAGDTFSLVDGSIQHYSVEPFSSNQINAIFPCMLSKIESILSNLPEVGASDFILQFLTHGDFSWEPVPAEMPEMLSRSDLMKLALYLVILEKYDTSCRVKADDAIFTIKNAASIPDDFMPTSFMEMVEGRNISDYFRVFKDLQPSFVTCLFPLLKIGENGPISVDSLVTLKGIISSNKDIRSSFLIDRIASEFNSFKESVFYKSFILGRSFRSIIFNLERKKSREVKKPLFNSESINSLLEIDIIDERNGSYFLKDEIDIPKLKGMYSEYEKRNHVIADEWKNTMIKNDLI